MLTPLPTTITSQIYEKITGLMQNAVLYFNENDFSIRQLLNDAKKLTQADAYQGHIANALIYHCCGNIEKCRHYLRAAEQLTRDGIDLHYFAAFCMSNLGFFSEAQQHYAISGDPRRGRFADEFTLGLYCGAFARMRIFIEQAEKMKFDMSVLQLETTLRAQAVLAKAGITDQDVGVFLDLAGEIMREERIFSKSCEIYIEDGPFDEPHCVYLSIKTERSGNEAARLSSALADKIVAQIDPLPYQFHIAFSPA